MKRPTLPVNKFPIDRVWPADASLAVKRADALSQGDMMTVADTVKGDRKVYYIWERRKESCADGREQQVESGQLLVPSALCLIWRCGCRCGGKISIVVSGHWGRGIAFVVS
jgi:hypothetical protein